MATYDHACIREMVFIALLEGIQIDKLLFDESREEQARLQENIQLAIYLNFLFSNHILPSLFPHTRCW